MTLYQERLKLLEKRSYSKSVTFDDKDVVIDQI